MEVRRVEAQAPETLGEHYARLHDDPRTSPDYREIGRRMLELLRYLRSIDGPPVWAITSHADLLLVDAEKPARRLIAIRGGGFGEAFSFGIEYPMPEGEAPWPGTRVLLGTHDTWQACEMIAYGLSKATGVDYSCRKRAEPSAEPDGDERA